jgi:hypothetical protein
MHAITRDQEPDGDDRAIDVDSAASAGGVNEVQHRALRELQVPGCGATFNTLTGTRLARLRHRDERLLQAQALDQGQTVRKAAGQLGVPERIHFACGIASSGCNATSRSTR